MFWNLERMPIQTRGMSNEQESDIASTWYHEKDKEE